MSRAIYTDETAIVALNSGQSIQLSYDKYQHPETGTTFLLTKPHQLHAQVFQAEIEGTGGTVMTESELLDVMKNVRGIPPRGHMYLGIKSLKEIKYGKCVEFNLAALPDEGGIETSPVTNPPRISTQESFDALIASDAYQRRLVMQRAAALGDTGEPLPFSIPETKPLTSEDIGNVFAQLKRAYPPQDDKPEEPGM